MWIGPDGEQAIISKRNGVGVMILAFQSRDTGFGIKISDAMIKLINKMRANKHYFKN